MIKLLMVILCLCNVAQAFQAKIEHLEVSPPLTDKNILQMRGPHQVFWNSQANGDASLLIAFGGTNSLPSDLNEIARLAAELGYDVLTIDYDNHVITTTCKESTDPQCFDHFREEVATGRSVSPLLEVSKYNSLENRIQTLLKHLAQKEPKRWSRYLDKDAVVWKKIVTIGHSQGSGHAAYLAKVHPLKGAILLAGPQDRFANGKQVNWLTRVSKTKPNRFYAFLHQKDYFGSEHQLANMFKLRKSQEMGTYIIVTEAPVADPHMSVILPQFRDAWKTLLQKAKSP